MLLNYVRLAKERQISLENQGNALRILDDPFLISVVTPVMMRTLASVAGQRQQVFLDATSSCDQMNTALTMFLIATKAGNYRMICINDLYCF